MMILLDTHVAYWLLFDSNKIPEHIKTVINENEDNIYVSTLSLWEIEIKHNKDEKLIVNGQIFEEFCKKAGITVIPFDMNDINDYELFYIQNIHKDPFDLALLSTCMDKGMSLLTHDKKLKEYSGVPIIYF